MDVYIVVERNEYEGDTILRAYSSFLKASEFAEEHFQSFSLEEQVFQEVVVEKMKVLE